MKPEAAPPALTPTSLFRASDETLAFPGLERVGAQFALGLADVIGSNGGVGTKLTCGETTIATFAEWRDQTSASNAAFAVFAWHRSRAGCSFRFPNNMSRTSITSTAGQGSSRARARGIERRLKKNATLHGLAAWLFRCLLLHGRKWSRLNQLS